MITEVFPCSFKAVIPVPSFTEYEKAVLRVHGEAVFVQLPEDFALETEAVKQYENLVVIRSVTKFYGMPGIRFGYGIAAESLIDTLQTARQPWSINTLAGFATLAAFKDEEFIQNTKPTIGKEKRAF